MRRLENLQYLLGLTLLNMIIFGVVPNLYFQAVPRLKPMPQTTPPQFEVAEMLNIQMMREATRQRR